MKLDKFIEGIPKLLFYFSIVLLIFIYGFAAGKLGLFPYSLFSKANRYVLQLKDQVSGTLPWYYQATRYDSQTPVYNKGDVQESLVLLTCVGSNDALQVRVIDNTGNTVHQWNINWFDLWPNPDHIYINDRPKAQPGTHIHGIKLMDNGDIIFNFTELGLIRLDPDGNVVWRLDYRTHHSINMDENGILWVPGDIHHHRTSNPDYPFLKSFYKEPTILKIDKKGQIIKETSVLDIFKHNNLSGMLVMSSKARWNVNASGDILHLNDIEVFPTSMQEGVFRHGDVMLSLRNIHTILVYDPETLDIRYMNTRGMVRQHDPDFLDGNTISIYDNNNIEQPDGNKHSRIILLDARNDSIKVHYRGTPEHPFFSAIMGNHQWQTNGNVLITESVYGRLFEINPQGEIVWEYINLTKDGYAGLVEEAMRLDPKFDRAFFNR